MAEPWTTEQIADQFRLEVQQRFAAENEKYRQEDRAEIEKIVKETGSLPDGLEERDSFFWEIYSNAEMRIEQNAVEVLLPNGFAIYPDFIAMFGNISVDWSFPSIGAVLVDGEPRLVIRQILIDYWDDDRQEMWCAEEGKARDA